MTTIKIKEIKSVFEFLAPLQISPYPALFLGAA